MLKIFIEDSTLGKGVICMEEWMKRGIESVINVLYVKILLIWGGMWERGQKENVDIENLRQKENCLW